MKEIAVKNFLEGYSCSESIVQAAIAKGYVQKELLSVATPFSGGMGHRCLCGAVAGSMIVIGALFGKNNERDGLEARAIAKEFNDKFKEEFKVTCCKVLSSGFDFHSPERKQHCKKMVEFCCDIITSILNEKLNKIQI